MGGGGKKAPVTLPPLLAKAAEAPGSHWHLFQVQPSLDWCKGLEGARLRLTPTPTLLAPQSTRALCARIAEQPLHQLLPLQPAKVGGSHKLHMVQGVQQIIRICEATPELAKADAAVSTAADEEAGAEHKRAAMQSRARAELARRRAETRQRCSIGPLEEIFSGFGLDTECFSLTLAQDGWDGQGAEPVAAAAAAEGAAQAAPEESSLHLKPVPLDQGGFSVPLACWRLGVLSPEAAGKLVFRHYLVSSGRHEHSQLLGQCDDAPLMLARGIRAKKPGPAEFRYLVGGQQAGSRRVYIFEAELFHVEPDRVADATKDASDFEGEGAGGGEDPEEQLSYWAQRQRMTATFGVAKRQRDTAKAQEKSQKRQFMELEQYASELSERVQSQEANLVDVEQRAEAKRRKMLPPYNPTASHPADIYREGLDSIAPWRLMQAEASLQVPEMISLLKRTAVELARLCESSNVIQSKLLAAALSTRSRSGTPGGADLAIRCEVLNRLTRIYLKAPKLKPPVAKAKTVAWMADLPTESLLAKHWHHNFFDEIPGRLAERSLNSKKLLAGMIVWALHLTPGLSLELDGSAAEMELMLMSGDLSNWLRNIGCTIDLPAKQPGAQGPQRLVATLSSPPKMDMERYQQQNRLSQKKKSRGGRGRGRG